MYAENFLEFVRKILFSLLTCFLALTFAYLTARVVMWQVTGFPEGMPGPDIYNLSQRIKNLERAESTAEEALAKGVIDPVERAGLEEQKKDIEEKLAEKSLSQEQRKKLEQQLQSTRAELEPLKKDYEKLSSENRQRRNLHDLIRLFVMSLLGLLFIAIGYFITTIDIQVGFVLGGLLCFIVGFTIYWWRLSDLLQIGVSALGLIAISILAYSLTRRDWSGVGEIMNIKQVQRILLVLVTSFFVYLFIGSVVRVIIQYATGVKAAEAMHSVDKLRKLGWRVYLLEDVAQPAVEKKLKRGLLDPGERSELEQKKLEIEKQLTAKPVGKEERKDLDQQLESIRSELEPLKKESDKLINENRQMRQNQYLILCSAMLILGLLFFMFGYIAKLGDLSAGFMVGGALSIIVSFGIYWYQSPAFLFDFLKIAVPVMGLIAIIVLTYRLTGRDR